MIVDVPVVVLTKTPKAAPIIVPLLVTLVVPLVITPYPLVPAPDRIKPPTLLVMVPATMLIPDDDPIDGVKVAPLSVPAPIVPLFVIVAVPAVSKMPPAVPTMKLFAAFVIVALVVARTPTPAVP